MSETVLNGRRHGGRAAVPFVVGLLVVVATSSWRPDTLYAGGVDAVVAAKAALSLLALGIAWVARQRCHQQHPMGTRTIWLLLAFLAVSTFGAWSTGDGSPSAVLSVRLLLLAATLVLLIRTYDHEEVLRSWLMAMMFVGIVGAVTGFPNYLAGGRLGGGVPPRNPNEIAVLCALPAIGVVWLVLTGRGRARHAVVLAMLLGIIWATGSRTSLVSVGIACGVMVLQARKIQPVVAFFLTCSVCALTYLTIATSILSSFFGRGGQESLSTLSSRTIAWSAALSFPETDWVRWLGAGLERKQVPVQGQYWDQQLLDSSFISALVQAGRVGAAILAVWIVCAVSSSLRRPRSTRMLLGALLAFLLLRSVLESGLVDSTPVFVTFFLVSLLAEKSTHREVTPSPISRGHRRGMSAQPSDVHPVPSLAPG